jgi:hypothetical protein
MACALCFAWAWRSLAKAGTEKSWPAPGPSTGGCPGLAFGNPGLSFGLGGLSWPGPWPGLGCLALGLGGATGLGLESPGLGLVCDALAWAWEDLALALGSLARARPGRLGASLGAFPVG